METYFPKRGESPDSALTANAEAKVRALVAEYPDATLVELSELLLQQTGNWVSRTALCRYLQKLGLNRKKKHGTVAKLEQKEYKS
jgi:transposase